MTTQQDELAQLIRYVNQVADALCDERLRKAAAFLEADAKGVEAVAWRSWSDFLGYGYWDTKEEAAMHSVADYQPEPLYTRPQQAAQVPLTDETVLDFLKELHDEQAGN